jgi:hypothetical protein
LDISIGGCRILAPAPWPEGEMVYLNIPEFGAVPSRVIEASPASFAVEFVNTDGMRDALIRKVYSGEYYTSLKKVEGRQVFGALVARSFR